MILKAIAMLLSAMVLILNSKKAWCEEPYDGAQLVDETYGKFQEQGGENVKKYSIFFFVSPRAWLEIHPKMYSKLPEDLVVWDSSGSW